MDQFLTLKGYSVTIVHNGKDGLELIKNNSFDKIVLDMSMPKFSGFDFLHEISAMGEEFKSKIVAYSAVPFNSDEINFIKKLGVSEFVSKRDGLKVLEKTLVAV